MKMIRTRRALALVLLLQLVVLSLAPALAMTNDQSERVVRVGYMDYPNFIEKGDDGEFTGYGAEYLEDICGYTNWEIEYVYAPWTQQLEMLEKGELDIVPLAQYTPERAERFTFTRHSAGLLQCMLFTLNEEDVCGVESYAMACEGKRIGVLKGSRNSDMLDRYAEQMGFSYIKVEYTTHSEMEDALNSGEVDIIACEQMINDSDFRVLDRFASDPQYFITRKDDIALLEEMDYIMSKISAYDPTYTSKLYKKYYGDGPSGTRPLFTNEEVELIKSIDTVNFALISDTMPYAYVDEHSEITGVGPDILAMISEMSGLKFEYEFVPQGQAPMQFIKEHPTFLAAGVVVDNPAFVENGAITSDVYFTSYSALYAREGENIDPDLTNNVYNLGLLQGFQAMQRFVQSNYPNQNVTLYKRIEDALSAVAKGDVDCFAYGVDMLAPYIANPIYADVVMIDPDFMPNPQCIVGMDIPRNRMLIDIINKCIRKLDASDVERIEGEHVRRTTYHFKGDDAFKRYSTHILMVSLAVMIIVSTLVTLLLIRSRRYNRAITRHALYDMTTGVYNRDALKERVTEQIARSDRRGGALLVVDIDDMQRINATRSHASGDKAICALAEILTCQLPRTALVGRIEGDEFCAYVSGIEAKNALVSMLTRILNTIASSEMGITVSIGVAMCYASTTSAEETYRRAEEALGRVKAGGKNGFAFYESTTTLFMKNDTRDENGEYKADMPHTVDADEEITGASLALLAEGDVDSAYRELLEGMPNVSVYVIERSNHQILYYNKRFREICPNVTLGTSCRKLQFGPCKNCIVDTMGEQAMAHSFFYSDHYGDELELTASRILWQGKIDAVMITSWPRNELTSSSDKLLGNIGQESFDYVTGGMTRVGLIRMVERMQRGGVELAAYALLFINIKDFKAVNEMVGCDGGDNLLHTTFERLEKSELSPIVGARMESDHFCFVVEQRALDLKLLPELLNFHWKYGEVDLYIHCRCGVFVIEDGMLDVYKMIDRAKLAKEHIVDDFVKPYAVYDPSMLQEYSERTSAFAMFDNGIKNNEFVVYYQPIINAKTGRIASAEALVRRVLPDGSVVSPAKFVPILERTGYISLLDRFVANTVGELQTRRVKEKQPYVPISVNFSQKDFYDADLMNMVTERFENSPLPRGLVMLELTESAYTLHERKHDDFLKHLRELGAKILLDDFGTGYSSFGMFENYNFDRVKLDMSFVRQLTRNENVRKVVFSIISMCHNLGVQVVAEGVEYEEELSILRDMDCDFIQGYYYSKPLDEKSFVKYVEDHI